MQNESGSWLILADIARRLDRPDSTVRKWAEIYGDLIPRRREGRSVLWPLPWFAAVRHMAEQNYTRREIRAALEQSEQEPPEIPRRPITVDDVHGVLVEILAVLKEIRDRPVSG